MAKESKKAHKLPTNTINSVLAENKPAPKSRQQIYQENYQKNKECKKAQQKENYTKKKEQEQLTIKQTQAKYYGAKSIKSIKEGINDIVGIMKLEQVANNLIRYEKARIENGYLTAAEQLEKQSQEYLKDIELAKFHEERGKIKCECYQCETQKEVQEEVKVKVKKEIQQAKKTLDDY
ncbi:5833_t:CDS:2 [Funneliformis geosporum]|nr:5833_t:CDS:2 [Funneliformis geosporum]